MENGKKPIYPFISSDGTPYDGNHVGLTKREYFAGLAMQGVLAHNHSQTPTPNQGEAIAEYAVSIADALLNELEKSKPC